MYGHRHNEKEPKIIEPVRNRRRYDNCRFISFWHRWGPHLDLAGGPLLRFAVPFSTTAGAWTIANPSSGVWHHIAVTYNGGGIWREYTHYYYGKMEFWGTRQCGNEYHTKLRILFAGWYGRHGGKSERHQGI